MANFFKKYLLGFLLRYLLKTISKIGVKRLVAKCPILQYYILIGAEL